MSTFEGSLWGARLCPTQLIYGMGVVQDTAPSLGCGGAIVSLHGGGHVRSLPNIDQGKSILLFLPLFVRQRGPD